MKPVILACVALLPLTASTVVTAGEGICKCFPGDACWPSDREWDAFNRTVGGRLIKTVPFGWHCHDPHYDETLCEQVRSQWKHAEMHLDSPSSIQAAIFTNGSCDPFTPRSSPCLMGNYVHYAVNVTGPEDIAATIRFAKKRNIRLVIKNTGHDYMGRSTGAGGLSIWTHYLKGVEIKDWSDREYTGKAIKIGAGTVGHEVLAGAAAAGLIVSTGECPTVGVAGGWVQNGGHSPLSTSFGLGADQTLEFEVVTADGRLVTARPFSRKYADLFWSLSGAGAGNYGVVVSVTFKAHPDAVTSGASFLIAGPDIDGPALMNAWHAALPDLLATGTMATYLAASDRLFVHSITGYNRTRANLEAALAPFVRSLAAMSIHLEPNYTQFPSYHDFYTHYFGPLPGGQFGVVSEQLMGSRLLPREDLARSNPVLRAALTRALQMGATLIGQATDVSRFATPARAVLPAWRRAASSAALCLPYDVAAPTAEMRARQDRITRELMPLLEEATPGGGAYINEADFQQPDWQRVFFGDNYEHLLRVKRKYDPEGVFWNNIAVGSEGWEVRADGRMCKV